MNSIPVPFIPVLGWRYMHRYSRPPRNELKLTGCLTSSSGLIYYLPDTFKFVRILFMTTCLHNATLIDFSHILSLSHNEKI